MTREEKHLSILSMYLTRLEKKYDEDFAKIEEVHDEDRLKRLVETYHKIEEVRKEIEQFKY